ncbi:ATP-binding/permease protein CydD [Candidatus Arsenophonus lipoptenae]|uniref:ATP-binding/permease protein CydD n=1 Tax=Candidatus Arsenophonus lipoptenae TaxID=634113 RepID=A0A0X9VTX7_9GAMM|nr:cysteine/glutathione ABC transporter permease/ATP-binding protein CydD [Candidatus Arsenophonus lipoptenae]AMA65207.1 ATP-binding/permease protein CydD [Candidatus Arsenophonus lipoptenae]
MNKQKQIKLIKWLKQQSIIVKKWIYLSVLLGIISGILIVAQVWVLADILQSLIVYNQSREQLLIQFILLICVFIFRSIIYFIRERVGFICGKIIRKNIRSVVLNKFDELGPIWVKHKPSGSWSTIILEQIDDIQDYYARYLPQMYLAIIIPIIILVGIIPINWVAGVILFITAPLIPLFMILIGMGAADINHKNFIILSRLGGRFLDRLRGLDTLRIFFRAEKEILDIKKVTEEFRKKNMDVLRIAFLSSAVLEFFTSISIALVAVYFSFSYLGKLHFGSYGMPITLFSGFLVLILAPEFFKPLRDLGIYYHAKATAIGAADTLFTLLTSVEKKLPNAQIIQKIPMIQSLMIVAKNLEIFSHDNVHLVGPLNFTILPNQRIAIVGHSGSGKSSLLNVLLGFLPYIGSLTVNGIELRNIDIINWREQLSWIGQNPNLPEKTIIDNICLSSSKASSLAINTVIENAYITEFTKYLSEGINTEIGENATYLSVGQVQKIAIARALLKPCHLLLLDEPVASLDMKSEQSIMNVINKQATKQTTLMITHLLDEVNKYDQIWVMSNGLIIEQGDYNTLIQSKGLFNQLLNYYFREV